MLLRYLQIAILKKATKTKQANGTYIEDLVPVDTYKIQQQELDDEISASIYGADIRKMLRIKSVRNTLEDYLYTKVDNKEDNISFYYISINGKKYKIVSVNAKGIDLEMV